MTGWLRELYASRFIQGGRPKAGAELTRNNEVSSAAVFCLFRSRGGRPKAGEELTRNKRLPRWILLEKLCTEKEMRCADFEPNSGQNLRHIRKAFHPRRPAGDRCGTRNDAVSGSGARFLPRFRDFSRACSPENLRAVSSRQTRRTRVRPDRPEIPGARDRRRQRASRQSELHSRPTQRRDHARRGRADRDLRSRAEASLAQPEHGLSSKRWRRPRRCRHGDSLGCRQWAIASRP